MHTYHVLGGASIILAVSSIGLIFLSKAVPYTFLVFPTLSFLHHVAVWLAVPSPIVARSSRRVNIQGRQRCAPSEPLNDIERSTLNLLSLALFTLFAIASGVTAWLFAVINLASSTTPITSTFTSTPTASLGNFGTLPASIPSGLVPEGRRPSPTAIWALQGSVLLAHAIVLASMFAIAAREARIATMANRRDYAYEAGHIDLDVEQPMYDDESSSDVDVDTVSGDKEEEK